MPAETLLITGSTGHVGYAVLLEALKKGYNVRAAVRSTAKAETVKSAPTTKPYVSQLSFVIVEDITVSGAFDEAVKGVDGIIQVASPIPTKHITDAEEQLLKPAIQGTTSILYSALKEKSVRRVVITSSIAATLHADISEVSKATDIMPERHPPFADLFDGYSASKTNANIRVRKFIQEEKPHFDIISIAPSYVIGKNDLATTPEQIFDGSNAVLLAPIMGMTSEKAVMNCVVHVDDVAYLHVAALDSKIPGNTNYGADCGHADDFTWEEAKKYTAEFFPEEVKTGVLPNNGHQDSVVLHFDSSETKRAFGFEFKTPAEMVRNIVGQYVAAVKQQQKQ